MHFNPKEVWQSAHVIYGLYMSPHTLPTIMQMLLPNGELETTDAENSSVFVPHFHRLFNNHISVDWSVLDKSNQREVMEELDQTISWDEINKSITKLVNNKSPGVNGVPPNSFKKLDNANLSWLLIFYNKFWNSQADSNKWP